MLLGVAGGTMYMTSDEVNDVLDRHVVSIYSFDSFVKKVTSTLSEILECASREHPRFITQTVTSAMFSLHDKEKDTRKKKKEMKYELHTDWLRTLIYHKLQPLGYSVLPIVPVAAVG